MEFESSRGYTFHPEFRLLVDMDGTIADIEGHFLNIWQQRYPERKAIPLQARTTRYLEDQNPPEWRGDIESILREKNFFANIPPFKKAAETLIELLDEGEDVWLCTMPLSGSQFCIEEKEEWIRQHLGLSWLDRLIITTDKTRHRGRILIDDASKVKGTEVPEWEHVIFDAPYNRGNGTKRRIKSWDYTHIYETLFGNFSDKA